MKKTAAGYIRVALSVAGSAILLCSCEGVGMDELSSKEETLMTEYSEDLSVVMSQNGRRSYHFVTPLLEGYSLAREPYREFRKGVKITTYQDDSLTTVDVVLTANYAIYYENRELWEAKGDVVAEKSDGKTLYTQQLFWNAKTNKIYSNVDSKIVQNNGRDVFIGEGFESDEEFKNWRFRRMKGRMEVDASSMQRRDSTAADSVGGRAARQTPGDSRDERPVSDDSREGQPAKDDLRGERPAPGNARVELPAQTDPKAPADRPVRNDDAASEHRAAPREPMVIHKPRLNPIPVAAPAAGPQTEPVSPAAPKEKTVPAVDPKAGQALPVRPSEDAGPAAENPAESAPAQFNPM